MNKSFGKELDVAAGVALRLFLLAGGTVCFFTEQYDKAACLLLFDILAGGAR